MVSRTRDLPEIVGREHMSDGAALLDSFSRDESFALPHRPRVVVWPGSEGEVAEIVAWANETATPLVAMSSAGPHLYGDTVPSVDGAVIVDLARMNAIRRIDRLNRMVVVEPGVTWEQLLPELAKEGMRVTPPLLPRPGKSVITTLLERQPTLIPRYNYSLPEPLRDCGVVWGSGERSYTGEAGNGPFELEKQWAVGAHQLDPKGPAQTDFFRLLTGGQGTFGIVTWASIKCELLPSAGALKFVTAPRLEDLVGFANLVTRKRLGDEMFILNRTQLVRMFGESLERDEAAAIPEWVMVIGVRGRELFAAERVAVQSADISDVAAGFGLSLRDDLPPLDAAALDAALAAAPAEPHWRSRLRGTTRDIFFLTTIDRIAGYVDTVMKTAAGHGYPPSIIGVYLQPQHQGVSWHVELDLALDPSDPRRVRTVHDVFTAAGEALIASGAYFSRPYGSWARPVYNRDAASTSALRRVKAIFDPNNVLNPGKLCF